jgi:hypothetical protein
MAGKGTKRKDEIELDPKGWERFERAVDAAVKSGPMHRTETKKRQRARRQSKKAR